MIDPICCGVPMWLNTPQEVSDRGGPRTIRAGLLWECLDCDTVSVAVVVTTARPPVSGAN